MNATALDATAFASRFLVREARLLDANRFHDWLALLAPDIRIQAPVRTTRPSGDGSEFSATTYHLDEDRYSLEMRVARLDTPYAWAENPPSRCRHFVSNVEARWIGDDELEAESNLLLYRTRGDSAMHEMLTGRRVDAIVREGDGARLRSRTIYFDQTTLTMSSLSLFL